MAGRFQIETQRETQWCWAAVSLGIHRYFSPQVELTQCAVAHKLIDADCCGNPEPCNQPQFLDKALTAVDRLERVVPRPLLFGELRHEIDRGRPVCARIGWFGGGGHFVILSGYRIARSGRRMVSVTDPLFADSVVDYDAFVNRYQQHGQWTAAFLVRA